MHCDAGLYDLAGVALEGRDAGNPVTPLVRRLVAAVDEDADPWVHWGATSQDVLDTAAMLVARAALELVESDLGRAGTAAAELAERHCTTLMVGRTLLQHAVPVTFGFTVAGWLSAVDDARRRVREVRTSRLAVQLGGAAGTLAPFEDRGIEVTKGFARRLGLGVPTLPWFTDRQRIVEVAAALAMVAGVAAKVGLDVALLSQTEVGEVHEAAGEGRGGSSTMPQKRNPVTASTRWSPPVGGPRASSPPWWRSCRRSTLGPSAVGRRNGRP